MPSYLSPGVYVEEVSGGAKPIAGVGTSTGAFVGIAEKGPEHKAELVTNWTQFVQKFGDFIPNAYLAYAVYSFFAEGGTACYVVRVVPDDAVAAATDKILNAGGNDVMEAEVTSKGEWGNRLRVEIADASDLDNTQYFDLVVRDIGVAGEVVEVYENLSVDDAETKINGVSNYLTVDVLVTPTTIMDPAGNVIPATRPVNGTYELKGGSHGTGVVEFANATNKQGLYAFDVVDDINIVAIPDRAGDRDLVLSALTYCENRKDCFFIADPPMGATIDGIQTFKQGAPGENGFNSSFGALYYPWVYISDPATGKRMLIPPSGAAAGTYAHTDATRGVHKAPAGTSVGYLNSVTGIETLVTKGEHDVLNPKGINVIRSFPAAGICIWGARTVTADPEWKYINIRRLFLFVEESIDKGTQWVVFEPNDPSLWGKVKRNLTAFLTRVWRDGALFGGTPDEAFFVKVDEENNPPEVRDAGQLIIEIGIAPVKPAEFVIIRISQKTLTK